MHTNRIFEEEKRQHEQPNIHVRKRWILIICICLINFIISCVALGLSVKSNNNTSIKEFDTTLTTIITTTSMTILSITTEVWSSSISSSTSKTEIPSVNVSTTEMLSSSTSASTSTTSKTTTTVSSSEFFFLL